MIDFLSEHPAVGGGASIVAAATPFIDSLSPYISFFALCLGFGVGALTMIIKAIDLYKKLSKKGKEEK